jgi:hypothetical protein
MWNRIRPANVVAIPHIWPKDQWITIRYTTVANMELEIAKPVSSWIRAIAPSMTQISVNVEILETGALMIVANTRVILPVAQPLPVEMCLLLICSQAPL